MKRKIVTGAIKDVGQYIKSQLEILKLNHQELIKDINRISEAYEGKDANLIIEKYLKRAKNLETIIKNFEYYGTYLEKIAGSYQENFDHSMKKMSEIETNNTPIVGGENIIEVGTFNLNRITNN